MHKREPKAFPGHHQDRGCQQLEDMGYPMEGHRPGHGRVLLPELLQLREGQGVHGCPWEAFLLLL